jgi:hypothetical protein
MLDVISSFKDRPSSLEIPVDPLGVNSAKEMHKEIDSSFRLNSDDKMKMVGH